MAFCLDLDGWVSITNNVSLQPSEEKFELPFVGNR